MLKLTEKLHLVCLSLLLAMLLVGCAQQTSTNTPVSESTPQVEPRPVEQPQPAQPAVDKDAEAKQKMAFAQRYFDMAQKGLMVYNQTVVLCRDVIKNYPGTPYVQQARELLRKVPEDQRVKFNITDEEMGR